MVEELTEHSKNDLICCIMKNYFKEQGFMNKKSTIVNLLLDIYQDNEIQINFERLNKYYSDLHAIREKNEEKDLFYLSEEQIKDKIEYFYNNYVVKTDKNLDIDNWFKKLNELYTYAKIIGIENTFKDEEIFNAMDSYLESLQIDNGLIYILDGHMPYQIFENKMLEYNAQLNKKIVEKYYTKTIDEIIQKIKISDYKGDYLDRLYTVYTENHIKFDKQRIINMMEEHKYFIPNLNYEISDKEWSWAHSIWEKNGCYREYRDDKGFEKCVNEFLKQSTVLGKYRIESLNRQYRIDIENLNKT